MSRLDARKETWNERFYVSCNGQEVAEEVDAPTGYGLRQSLDPSTLSRGADRRRRYGRRVLGARLGSGHLAWSQLRPPARPAWTPASASRIWACKNNIVEAVQDSPVTDYGMVDACEPLSDSRAPRDTRCRIVLHINCKAPARHYQRAAEPQA